MELWAEGWEEEGRGAKGEEGGGGMLMAMVDVREGEGEWCS